MPDSAPALRDTTPRPAPCPTCAGEVFWRKAGESSLECQRCAPCSDVGAAFWYGAATEELAAYREQLKAERATQRAKGGR